MRSDPIPPVCLQIKSLSVLIIRTEVLMLRMMDRHGNCAGVVAAAPLEVVHTAVRVPRYVDRCCNVTQTASKRALPHPTTF